MLKLAANGTLVTGTGKGGEGGGNITEASETGLPVLPETSYITKSGDHQYTLHHSMP